MGRREKKRATYDDLLRLPEHQVGEILDGELIVSPRPASPQAMASSVLGADLVGSFHGRGGGGAPGGWWILDEPELHFGQDVVVPDLAGWRRERMPRMPEAPFFELAPDWVCEVVSPSTARLDRSRKMDLYARVAIPHLWMLDPLARTIEVFRLEQGAWLRLRTHAGDERARLAPFEAVELDPGRWWLEEEPGSEGQ
jgi:Uma2 family endonuclease